MDYKDLDQFGEEFIQRVRDASIEEYIMVESGEMQCLSAQKVFKHFNSFSEDEIKKIDAIVLDVIGMMLHKVLFMFEGNDSWAIVEKDSAENAGLAHLDEVSDGLAGELYSDEGWVEKFSKYKRDSLEEK